MAHTLPHELGISSFQDFITFTEEILREKLGFCAVTVGFVIYSDQYFIANATSWMDVVVSNFCLFIFFLVSFQHDNNNSVITGQNDRTSICKIKTAIKFLEK